MVPISYSSLHLYDKTEKHEQRNVGDRRFPGQLYRIAWMIGDC